MPSKYKDYKIVTINISNGQTRVLVRFYEGDYITKFVEATGQDDLVYERADVLFEKEFVFAGEYTHEQLVTLLNDELSIIKGKWESIPEQKNG